MIKDLESPKLANRENILVQSVNFFAESNPPFNPNVTIPLDHFSSIFEIIYNILRT